MRKNKLFLLLALLLTAATGAWAQTPLVTIESKDYVFFTSGSKTFDDKVTVTFSNLVYNDGDEYGWFVNTESLLTVAGINGYTITSCKFYTDSGDAKTGYTIEGESPSVNLFGTGVYTDANKSVYIGSPGITKIEVYTAASSAPASSGYTVSLKDGVKDADKWTVKVGEGQAQALPIGGLKGDGSETVTLQYNGRLKVKGVKATSEAAAPSVVDLATLTENTELKDGNLVTGTLAGNYKITIADGATVTLDGVSINGVNNANYEWAGITCLGDATIILSGTNTVKGFYQDYPGIRAAADKTLTINGTGSLTASSYGYGAGIGGGSGVACGNIEIQGGTITATSVKYGAGIGGGNNASCGNITISGGTVTATGGERGAGIGSGRRGNNIGSCGNILISGGTVEATGGNNAAGIGGGRGYNSGNKSSCGTITIITGVTKVTATKGDGADNSIGAGKFGTCGTVTIGGTKYWENNAAVNGGDTYLAQSPLIYDPTAPAKTPATVTTAPTGAAIVGRLNTNAMKLVSGGVAEGGTMMYKVQATKTKPPTTVGFSADVPTAEGITASGKVYVWYYVKGDDTHTDSEIAATPIVVPVADVVWDATNVSGLEIWGTDPYEMDGVKLSGNADNISAGWVDYGDPTTSGIVFEPYESGGYTFTAPSGKAFTKIEMKAQSSAGWYGENLGTGWAYFEDGDNEIYTVTWTGSAASTDKLLPDTDDFSGAAPVKCIAFYLSE